MRASSVQHGPWIGQEITKRNVSIQPTLTIRRGFPMRVMVNKDAQTYGESIDAATLIPHVLEAFMARDRGFKRAARPRSAVAQRNEKAAPG